MSNEEQQVLQKHLIEHLVHEVFNSVTDDDILQTKTSTEWYLRGKKLDAEHIQSLRDSATQFSESSLWKLMYGELQYHAQLASSNAKTEADLVGAKEMKRIMAVMRRLLERMTAQ